MQPVQEILSRIRWDEEFGDADFEIGYYDRIEGQLILVPYESIYFPIDNHFLFELLDKDGIVHRIPYHRIREVKRNGHRVWSRMLH